MSDPLPYSLRASFQHSPSCLVCGVPPTAPMIDHCHQHGWIRGTLCRTCNLLMGQIDQGQSPIIGTLNRYGISLSSLLAHRVRCVDCASVEWSGPVVPRARTAYTAINVTPAAAADLRIFTARISGVVQHRVTQTDALRLAAHIAITHLSDVRTASVALGIIREESR